MAHREDEAFIPATNTKETAVAADAEQDPSARAAAGWLDRHGVNRSIAAGLSAAGVVVTVIVLLFVFATAPSAPSAPSAAALSAAPPPQGLPSLQGQEDCGLSPAEARARGCVFDPVLLGWVPWRCHDAQLAADFLRRHGTNGDRAWTFSSSNGTTPPSLSQSLTLDDLLAGEFDEVYAEFAFLLLHCSYTRRKVQRAAVLGEIADGYTADAHQSAHCEMWTLWRTALDDTGTSVYNKYATCPRTHRDVGRYGWYRVVGGRKIYRQNT